MNNTEASFGRVDTTDRTPPELRARIHAAANAAVSAWDRHKATPGKYTLYDALLCEARTTAALVVGDGVKA